MSKRKSWAERLARAEANGHFAGIDVFHVSGWTSCAIGERHDWPAPGFVPVYESDEWRLGRYFMKVVRLGDIAEAKRVYAQIQALP